MRNRRARWTRGSAALVVALATVGAALAPAQDPAAKANNGAKAKNAPVTKKVPPNAADPLGKAGPSAATHHVVFKIVSSDGTALASTYYPAKLGTTAPVVLLVHEKDRSSKDFEEPIPELKGQGLAEHLHGLGYAVLSFDLRGQGLNLRRPLAPKDWRAMGDDLQAAYTFLVDRNNRGELNLAKLGVVAVGEGANLAGAWAALPGGAVSQEGRTSDVAALVLVSPLADGEGFLLRDVTRQLAANVPLLLMVGQRDAISAEPVKSVTPLVLRARLNKVELFDTSLHGFKLLRLEPKAPAAITRFLEGAIKFKPLEWEPRYNLNPVAIKEVQTVRNTGVKGPAEPARDKAKAQGEDKAKDDKKAKNRD